MRWGLISWTIFALTLCSATTVIPMSIEELTQSSTAVVEARALESWSQWNAEHSIIHTYTRFQVAKSLKGGPAGTIVVKQLGGSAEGYTQRVAGVRQFQAGDDAVLFLRPSDASDGTMVITGLLQGNFRLARSAGATVVSNGIPGVHALSRGAIAEFEGAQMTLHELEQRVRGAVTK